MYFIAANSDLSIVSVFLSSQGDYEAALRVFDGKVSYSLYFVLLALYSFFLHTHIDINFATDKKEKLNGVLFFHCSFFLW